jgi:hypothetical protein
LKVDGVSIACKSIRDDGSSAGADKKEVTMVGDGLMGIVDLVFLSSQH